LEWANRAFDATIKNAFRLKTDNSHYAIAQREGELHPSSAKKKCLTACHGGAKNRDVVMHFIERIFDVRPDGDSGSSEFFLFVIPTAALCYLALKRWLRWLSMLGEGQGKELRLSARAISKRA
jgi:hypothetical protein